MHLRTSHAHRIAFLASLLVAGSSACAQETGLIAHFGPEVSKIEGNFVLDVSGKLRAEIVGEPRATQIGPARATAFDGLDDCLLIAKDIADSKVGLPTKAFSAAAWVNIQKTTQYGGIIGAMQDNGNFEKGWVLGYTHDAFVLALSTTGADDGDGKLTYLKGRSGLQPGAWYHVAGTYDGATMRLYVNGQLHAESKEQSGDILYPAHAPYVIGAYMDKDENFPMQGALVDVKVYDIALSGEQIAAAFTPGAELAKWTPVVDAAQGFVVKPYLQWGRTDEMTIMCETTQPARAIVEYGDRLPLAYRTELGALGTMHQVRITGLQPQSHYLYRVVLKHDATNNASLQALESDLSTFQTAPLPDAAWSFTVIGDTQRNPAVIGTLSKLAYSLRPNMQIHCGDVVDQGPSKDEWTKEMLLESHPLMSRVVMFPCIGNHEQNHSYYYQYFALPGEEYCYTYTYGNAQFWSVDTNKPVDPGSSPYQWLDKTLGESTATWKFVYHHHPVYSSDENDYGDTYKGPSEFGDKKVRPLVDLYEKHHVDINFNGHIHVYERSWPVFQGKVDQDRGVIYVTSGGGGGGLEAAAPSRTWFQRRFYRGHHICYLTIHDRTLQMQAFDLEGRLFDQMDIVKKPSVK